MRCVKLASEGILTTSTRGCTGAHQDHHFLNTLESSLELLQHAQGGVLPPGLAQGLPDSVSFQSIILSMMIAEGEYFIVIYQIH